VHGPVRVRQSEMNKTEQLLAEQSASETDVTIGNLKRSNLQVLTRFYQNFFELEVKLRSEIHKIIKLFWKKNCLTRGRTQFMHLFTKE
jgi:hypothetical protein